MRLSKQMDQKFLHNSDLPSLVGYLFDLRLSNEKVIDIDFHNHFLFSDLRFSRLLSIVHISFILVIIIILIQQELIFSLPISNVILSHQQVNICLCVFIIIPSQGLNLFPFLINLDH